MLPKFTHRVGAKSLQLLICAVTALALTACGGGGGSPGTTNTGGGSGNGGVPGQPSMTMSIADGSGAAITTLSGGQNGVVKVTVLDAAGKPAPSQIVTFVGDAALIVFKPESASALTDAAGVAIINVTPASVTSSGAVAITATSAVGTGTATKTVNIAVGAAPLTVGTLSFVPAPTGSLAAFSTAALNIPITSGGAPASSVDGLTMTSLCVGDGTATLVKGSLSNGVQLATYTNNGCLRITDTITVSIGNSSKTIQIGVDAADIGTIEFVGTDLNGESIVLKGSGGLGRKEAAVVTFRVVDRNKNGLAGVDVSFTPTTSTGGLSVLPAKATTNATGFVTTTVSSGTIPTPVVIMAEASRNGKTISGRSESLIISTGLPIQKSLSLSSTSYNIEGWNADNEIATITVRLADQYGNPISDNTAINFVTEGGAIGSSLQGACTTIDGGCSVPLKSQNFRPTNGRVTVLAYVQGVENFIDSNGDGQYSCTSFTNATGGVSTSFRPLVDICVSGGEPFTDQGDPFLDTGNSATIFGQPAKLDSLDGVYTAANGDQPFPYNRSTYSATGNGRWGINYIVGQAEIVFSGQSPTLVRQFVTATGTLRDWTAADGTANIITGLAGAGCTNQNLYFRIHDLHNNPMPKDTAVTTTDVDKVAPLTMSPNKVGSTAAIGGTYHAVTIKPDTACAAGIFSVLVTTPKGLATAFPFRSN
jgi:hypothetical protein